MKIFKNLSINIKVPVMVGMASLFALAVICVSLATPLRKASMRDATMLARGNAELAGEKLSVKINGSGDAVRAYSGVIKQLITSAHVSRESKREMLIKQITSE